MLKDETQLLIIEYLNAGLIPYVPFSGIKFNKKPTRKQKRKFRKLWRKLSKYKDEKSTSCEKYPSFTTRRYRKTIVLGEMFSRVTMDKK